MNIRTLNSIIGMTIIMNRAFKGYTRYSEFNWYNKHCIMGMADI